MSWLASSGSSPPLDTDCSAAASEPTRTRYLPKRTRSLASASNYPESLASETNQILSLANEIVALANEILCLANDPGFLESLQIISGAPGAGAGASCRVLRAVRCAVFPEHACAQTLPSGQPAVFSIWNTSRHNLPARPPGTTSRRGAFSPDL